MLAWIEEGVVSIPSFLLNHYKKIGLTDLECMLLIHVYAYLDRGNDFPTPEQLSQKMMLTKDECSQMLRSLIQRGLLEIINGQTDEGIYYEKYSLQPLWKRLFEQYIREQKDMENNQQNQEESSLYTIFEQEFARPLSPIEYETLTMWLDHDHYSASLIKAALREAVISGKLNFRYIDRILFEWKKNGIETAEQAKEHAKNFRLNQQKTKTETKRSTNDVVPFYNWLES